MAVVDTAMGLRVTVESARKIRFDPNLLLTATNVQTAIEQVVGFVNPIPTSIAVGASPYSVLSTDRVLLVNTAGGPITINMLPASSHPLPLEIKDDTGHAAANPITVVPNGAETIDGLTSYPMDSNYSDTTFVPQSGGYYVQG